MIYSSAKGLAGGEAQINFQQQRWGAKQKCCRGAAGCYSPCNGVMGRDGANTICSWQGFLPAQFPEYQTSTEMTPSGLVPGWAEGQELPPLPSTPRGTEMLSSEPPSNFLSGNAIAHGRAYYLPAARDSASTNWTNEAPGIYR